MSAQSGDQRMLQTAAQAVLAFQQPQIRCLASEMPQRSTSETQPAEAAVPPVDPPPIAGSQGLEELISLTPKELVEHLDRNIVGQVKLNQKTAWVTPLALNKQLVCESQLLYWPACQGSQYQSVLIPHPHTSKGSNTRAYPTNA